MAHGVGRGVRDELLLAVVIEVVGSFDGWPPGLWAPVAIVEESSGPASGDGGEHHGVPATRTWVRRRSVRAVKRSITALWVTSDGASVLLDRAPWVLVDDQPWHVIASRRSMLVRAGARNLQDWRCDETSQRPCPGTGGIRTCGGFHAHWDLPALCLPPRPTPELDETSMARLPV